MSDEIGGRPDVVVVGAIRRSEPVQDLLLLTAEHHTGVAVHSQLTSNRRSDDRCPVNLVGKVAHVLLQHIRKDVKGTVLVSLHALGDAQDGLARLRQLGQLFTGPVHTERVDAAHDDVGPLDGFGSVSKVIGLDAFVDLELENRMLPGGLDGINDLVIEVGADETDVIAVLDSGEGQCGSHDARTEHCNLEHLRTSEGGLWPGNGPDTIHANH